MIIQIISGENIDTHGSLLEVVGKGDGYYVVDDVTDKWFAEIAELHKSIDVLGATLKKRGVAR